MDKENLYRMSYYQQMANVSGEVMRLIRLNRKGASAESMYSHFVCAINLLLAIFHDPKNELYRKQIQKDIFCLAHYYLEEEKKKKREAYLMHYYRNIDEKYIEELRNN